MKKHFFLRLDTRGAWRLSETTRAGQTLSVCPQAFQRAAAAVYLIQHSHGYGHNIRINPANRRAYDSEQQMPLFK